jgi:glycine/D-amino acid oxidase-like deaminating enzyme/nitrite reductase/ring-hydroxylating ferredoxin subunit
VQHEQAIEERGRRNRDGTGQQDEKTHVDAAEGWEVQRPGRTRSPWFEDVGRLDFGKLDEDKTADVVIVGAGIAGITTAYFLSKEGKEVAVVDDGHVGSGETGRTTAHITNALDDRYYNILRMHGKEKAILAAASHTTAIRTIESVVRMEGIDCGFERVDGYLFLDPSDRRRSLDHELESTHAVGLETEIVERAPIGSFDSGPSIRFPDQAQFHPIRYLAGLTGALVRLGGQVFTDTHVEDVTTRGVTTSEGLRIRAGKVVVATNAPIVDKVSGLYKKQDAFRTYVIAATVEKGTVLKGLYWDTGNRRSKSVVPPYHYVRTQELEDDGRHELLIAGGEDHSTANAVALEERFSTLEKWTRERFPILDIKYRWSGQVMEPRDAVAFIGRNPRDKRRNVFIATGDSGNGITHGTIAGLLLTDLILGRKNAWSSLYDPSRRFRGHAAAPYGGKPDLHKMKQEDVAKAVARLKPGHGMVAEVRRSEEPLAFYRDASGTLHGFSALCPHLQCTLRWNDVEGSFDCPCHGSRFSCDGCVVNGPADEDLSKATKNKSNHSLLHELFP